MLGFRKIFMVSPIVQKILVLSPVVRRHFRLERLVDASVSENNRGLSDFSYGAQIVVICLGLSFASFILANSFSEQLGDASFSVATAGAAVFTD